MSFSKEDLDEFGNILEGWLEMVHKDLIEFTMFFLRMDKEITREEIKRDMIEKEIKMAYKALSIEYQTHFTLPLTDEYLKKVADEIEILIIPPQ